MAAIIFSGAYVKALKDNLKMGVAENIFILTGDSDDPTVVAKDAPAGSIYFRFTTSEIYQKLDNGTTTNFSRMDGDVKGPGATTDHALARWDGVNGLLLQDSNVLLDDTDNLSGIVNITLSGTVDGRDVSVDGTTLDTHLNGGTNKHDSTEIDYERVDGSKVDIQAASDDVELALTDLDDRKLSRLGNNTMGADLDMGTNAITNVGNVDGRDVSADGTALDTHLNGGASKHDATEIDYERVDGSKKNIQASSDDLEAATTDLDDAIGSLVASPTNYTPAATTVTGHQQGIDSALGSITDLINNFEWQESALDYIVDNTLVPPTEVSGDRYVLSDDGGAPNAAYDGASAGDVVEFDGTVWGAITPSIGMMISIDDETSSLRQWGGSSWDQKFFESTTASGFMSVSTFDVQLTNLTDNNLIIGNGSNVATSVDTSSLGDIEADTVTGLQIKAGVIVNADVNTNAAIDASKIHNGDVSNTEYGYLDGVSSSIQTQLDAKLDDFSSTTDNAITRTDGTTGEAIQDSLITIDDLGALAGATQINVDNLQLNGNTISSTDTDGDVIIDPNGTGDIDASTSTIKNVVDPTNAQDAATKAYVDATPPFRIVSTSGVVATSAANTYLIDTSGGVATLTLPSPVLNAYIRVKDSLGNAFTNNITVNPNAAETIDGAASYVMDSDFEAKIFVSNGTSWSIL